MRRSQRVSLAAVSALAAAFTGCGDDEESAYCVDRNDRIVDNANCGDEYYGGSSGYFWYFGGNAGPRGFVRGERINGGQRVASTNKSALAQRGGFGGTAGPGGVGRSVSGSSGGG